MRLRPPSFTQKCNVNRSCEAIDLSIVFESTVAGCEKYPKFIITSSFARFSYSECGLRSLRSLTHMGMMRQGGNVTDKIY